MDEEILTAREVACFLRVSEATISRWARGGRLRALDVPGRLLFRQKALDDFLDRARPVAGDD